MLAEEIQFNLEKAFPFVLYKKPGQNAIFYAKEEPNGKHQFIFSSFLQEVRLSFYFKEKVKINDEIERGEEAIKLPKTPLEDQNVSREEYQQKITEVIRYIKKGEAKKIVFSRTALLEKKIDILHTYRRLCKHYPNAFCYIWFHPLSGVWLGATPEMLVKIKELQLETMSLAGTKKRHDVWTDKEIKEQQIVSDYIKTQLNAVARKVKTSHVQTIVQGEIQHLQTKINAELLTKNYDQVIQKIHPTPAVCGVPMEKVKRYLQEHEEYNRSFYTGFLGEAEEDSMELYVNLRCAQLNDDQIKLYVGGGVNELSDPLQEWKETELKLKIIQRALVERDEIGQNYHQT